MCEYDASTPTARCHPAPQSTLHWVAATLQAKPATGKAKTHATEHAIRDKTEALDNEIVSSTVSAELLYPLRQLAATPATHRQKTRLGETLAAVIKVHLG